MENVEVICPLYNAANYILELHDKILSQKKINIVKINYILTESNDNTRDILINNNIDFVVEESFSHYLTRQRALNQVETAYAIMLTQDIVINDDECFYKLVNYVKSNDLAICYARQVAKKGLDKYYREISYSKESYVYEKKDLDDKGLDACFCSDACSCYNVEIFKQVNGYDNKDYPTNEDMYYAYKCLINNYKVGYCAEAFVYHTHNYALKQTYSRYIKIGQFFKGNSNIAKLRSSKKKYVKVILKALKHLDIIALIKFPFDVLSRMLGMHKGKK